MRNPGNSLTSTILLYSNAVATSLDSQCTPKVAPDPTGGEQCSVRFFDCVGDAVGKLEPTPAACTSGGTGSLPPVTFSG